MTEKKKTATAKMPKELTENSEMGIFARFWRVFTPSFLGRLMRTNDMGKSWGFWFLSNLFLTLVLVVGAFVGTNLALNDFPENVVKYIPEDASFQVDGGEEYNVKKMIRSMKFSLNEEGELSTEGVPNPIIFYGQKDRTGEAANIEKLLVNTDIGKVTENQDFAFVLDTSKKLEDFAEMKTSKGYLIIAQDGVKSLDSRNGKIQIMPFKEMLKGKNMENLEFPLEFAYSDLAKGVPFLKTIIYSILGVWAFFIFLFLAVARILNALLWALLYWLVGAIVGIKNWSFGQSIEAMLHFSFVTILFVPLTLFLDISVFLYSLIVFTLLFAMNFWAIKARQ